MGTNFSDYLEQAVLGVTLCGSVYTAPTTVYMALFTACSSDGSDVTEVPTATGYGRQVVAFGSISGGTVPNSGNVTFSEATTAWGTITHMGLYDAVTSGNQLYWGILDASRTVDTGDTFQIPDGLLDVSID